MKNEWKLLVGVCAMVIGVYAYAAYSGFMARPDQQAVDAHYNQLVEGFQAGQLNLKVSVPAGLTQLANPYDPNANALYRSAKYGLDDLSYYKGKLYLYFGVTPALLLFWPFVALTGHYLYDAQAVVIFCALGFLGSVGILCAVRRRYFPEVSIWVVAAGALALGLAPGVPMLLPRSNVNEAANSCAYMLTMLALGAIWCALHAPERRWRWLAGGSVAYGLAVGARPTLVFGAIILLAPVVQAWRERRAVWPLLLAATMPITLIGLGLMLYNARRFDSPFEFGMRSCLTIEPLFAQQFFHMRYLWFNFHIYFLEPLRWGTHFPFVHGVMAHHRPSGYARVEAPYGIPTSVPLVWLALAVPLSWRDRPREAASILRWFGMVVGLQFAISALTIGFYNNAIDRYEVDFLPSLMLLAVVGIFGLERALVDRRRWRCVARWGWGLLLGFSVAFNLLASVKRCADVYDNAGVSLQELGKIPEAVELFQRTLRINPDFADAHLKLGDIFLQEGNVRDAIGHYEQVLRIDNDSAVAHFDLGLALMELGKQPEAAEQYEQALRIRPDFAEAHLNLGVALEKLGRTVDAIGHYEEALRIKSDYLEAHLDLGTSLFTLGRVQDAITHYKEALQIKPDYVQAHYNLGLALERVGHTPDAIGHYEEALRIKSNYPEAHLELGAALFTQDRVQDAITHYEEALQIRPDYVQAHYNLGLALERLGRTPEAIQHYQQALKLRPDLTAARNALTRLGAGR